MSVTKEIVGGYAHKCDVCETEDGRPSLFWEEKDFDICYECLKELNEQHCNKVP